jgi:B12-binding domain/radical SAM domain protein
MQMRKPDSVRFTFVYDRFNRTAIASLLSALEGMVDDPLASLRVVRSEDLERLDFEVSDDLPEILCMSTMTVNADRAIALHERVRKRWGDAFISIFGGAHASGVPAGLLQAGVDYCCSGEGEEVVRAVYRKALERESLANVDGLLRLGPDGVNGKRAAGHVDIGRYSALPARISFPTYLEAGRGCRWACAFCQTPRIHGTFERYRNPSEMEKVVAHYATLGMKDFRFLLPNALGYMSEAPGVPNCEALDELLGRSRRACRGGRLFLGSFPSEIRPDYVTEAALRVLRSRVSNRGLVIGGQSGSGRMLDSLNRGHSVDDIRTAYRIALGCGFEVSVDLVLGFPGETAEDRTATLNLVEEMGATGVVSNMHFFMPLPGTPLMGARPVFLSEAERRRLDRFGQRGILRGRWRHQEVTARMWTGR